MGKLNKKHYILGGIILAAVLLIVYIILSLVYKYPYGMHLEPHILDPYFLEFKNFEIRWYAICVVGGACLVALYGYYGFAKRCHLDGDTTLTGVTIGIISGVLGARLYYVIFEHEGISFDNGIIRGIIDIINPAGGGLAIHGGIYAAALFVFIYCIVKKIKFLELIEIVLPLLMLGQVIGRWGNFFNQEAYGPLVNGYPGHPLTSDELIAQRETLRHLLVPNFVIDQMYLTSRVLVDGSYIYVQGYYHPTFFYESMANLIGAFTYIFVRKYSKKVYVGDGICFYLTWYGFVRFFIELLRQDPLVFNLFGIKFKAAIVTSILFFAAGITLFILRRVFKIHMVSTKEFFYEGGVIWKDGYNGPEQEKAKQIEEKKYSDVVVFDCDGTLLDTYGLIMFITRKVLEEQFPDRTFTEEEVESFFGPLLDESFAKYSDDPEVVKTCVEQYRKYNVVYHPDYVKAYDGIKELLENLRMLGFKTVIVSNKITKAIKMGLKIAGIEKYVDEIIGVEKLVHPKPDPDGIMQVINKYSLDKVLFVGDTNFDIQCGKNVKELHPALKTVGVTWCKTSREEFESFGADYIIDHPMELLEVLDKYAKL